MVTLTRTLTVVVHPAAEGGYWADVLELPGCASQGETIEELQKNIREAIEAVTQHEPLAGELRHCHAGMTISSMEKALPFYRDVLGMQVVRTSDSEPGNPNAAGTYAQGVHIKTAWLRLGDGFTIELVEYVNKKEKTLHPHHWTDVGAKHLAFYVEDIWAEYERLKAHGVWFRSPPHSWGPGKDTSTYGRDPDGNYFEIMQAPPDTSPPPSAAPSPMRRGGQGLP